MILLAALSSWLAMRTVAITPLGVARRTQAGRVSAVGPVLGLVLLVVWLSVGTAAMSLGPAIGMAVFMGFMGAIFLIVNLVGVWSISLMGRIMASVARTPQMMVAGSRMADDPRTFWRSFGAVALVGFLVYIMYPASSAISMSGERTDEVALVVIGDINRGMLLTFAITLALGAVSTAVNRSIRVLDSADQVRALSSMGSPRGFMDRSRRLRGNRPAASPHPRERTRGTRVTLFSVDACPGLGLIPLDEAGPTRVTRIISKVKTCDPRLMGGRSAPFTPHKSMETPRTDRLPSTRTRRGPVGPRYSSQPLRQLLRKEQFIPNMNLVLL